MQNVYAARAFDRRLFIAAAILFPLIVLVGFAPTYYARTWFGSPALPSTIVAVHGALMSLWVLLFVVQVALISSRHVRIHQRLGWLGAGLGVCIVFTGLITALRSGKYGSASAPPQFPPLAFMVVPLFDLLMFVVFFGGAVYFRKKPASHKAMMLLTIVNFLPPALGRIRVPALQAMGPLFFFGVPTLIALVALALDARVRGRVNRLLLGGTLLLVASYVVRLSIMMTEPWMQFARWATSFV
jgi:hypothetical protein